MPSRRKTAKVQHFAANVGDTFEYQVTGDALAKQIDRRVQFYEDQVKAFASKRDEMAMKYAEKPSMLALIPTWDTLIQGAKNRADFLRFQRDSLVTDITYRVDDVMLARLDLTLEALRKEEVARATWSIDHPNQDSRVIV